MSTYTITRTNYYQNNKEEIKRKRKIHYYKNILQERQNALKRHDVNKKRNNKISLKYYHQHSSELDKKRTISRRKKQLN